MAPHPLRTVTAVALALLLGLVAGGPAAATALAAGPSPARAAATGGPVVGVASGRCLDVSGASTALRTPVLVHTCHGRENQRWSLTERGELRVYGGTLCLDARGRGTTPGTVVQTYTCHGGDWQRWRVGADGTVRGVASGLCLDVTGRATADRSPVQLWACNGGDWQRWEVPAVAPDTTPPTVPTGLRLSDLTCRRATLTWAPSTDAVGVAAYDVYHDGQLMTSVPGTTTSAALDLVPGARWGLYVNARDAAGNLSQASTSLAVTVPQCSADTSPPTRPEGLTATAQGTAVTLRWRASTDDVGVREYRVLRGDVQVGVVTGTATTPPATTSTDSGLPPRTAHTYAVLAVDAQGNTSPRSATATVTTGATCASDYCGVTRVATDTDLPWGLATAPDGSVLYTRRDAHEVVRLDPATGRTTVLGRVPGVVSTDGEGGLLGLALSPTFATDQLVFVMHTSPTDTRVVRLRLVGGVLDPSTTQVLVSGMLRNKYHDGGRLRFGPDGKLYVATGDGQVPGSAQDLRSLSGKVLRINPDGTVPADNPFGTAVWSYGHRNPQGLAFDSRGRLWEQEFGNSVMDETNLVVRGGNYGWPACEGTSGACGTPGLVAPKATYPVAAGSCSGIAVVRDVLHVACLRGARLYRAPIVGDSLATPTSAFSGTYGRLRTVEPDGRGGLWLTTSNLGDKDSVPGNSDESLLRVDLGG